MSSHWGTESSCRIKSEVLIDSMASVNVVRLSSDGRILLQFPEMLSVYCKLDVVDFPFDQQTCTWELGSWSLYGHEFRVYSDPADSWLKKGVFKPNSEWEILNASVNNTVNVYNENGAPQSYYYVESPWARGAEQP